MSETITQTLARNPLTGANLTRGDAFRILDASEVRSSRDAAILIEEIVKALVGFGTQNNAAGNLLISPHGLSLSHLEVITFSGAGATTRIIVLDTSATPIRGSRVLIRCEVPATPGITVEFRDSDVGGTVLTSFETDASGDDKVAEFYFDGNAWQFLQFNAYANA